jgi:hypothetical protein
MGMVRCGICKRPYFQKDAAGCPNMGCRQSTGVASVNESEKLQPIPTIRIPVASSAVAMALPKKETWKETEARLSKEREDKKVLDQRTRVELGNAVQRTYETMVITQREGMFFRCCGRGQEPWDLVSKGFEHRSGKRNASELKGYLAAIYGTAHGGAKNYMTLYRACAANNPASAPFISAGIKPGDPSGASNAFWQYAMETEGLVEVTVTKALLGLADDAPALSANIGDVRLLMNDKNFDLATTRVLFHGPMPEATWLSHIEESSIKAWTRIGGDLWQQEWRQFNGGIITGIRTLATEYGKDIAQGG